MNIYKTVFDTEEQGKEVLIQKGVWEEVTEEGVTSMQYINGTESVVNIGKVVEIPATYDDEGNILTPAVYYPGWAYDIMSTDTLDFGDKEVYPGAKSAHSFFGYPIGEEVEEEE